MSSTLKLSELLATNVAVEYAGEKTLVLEETRFE